jgi:hypothetical protein
VSLQMLPVGSERVLLLEAVLVVRFNFGPSDFAGDEPSRFLHS